MSKEKFKVLRVTVTEDYFIDMIDDKKTCINGWTLDELIQDWFEKFSMGTHHASREYHKIGNSRKYVKTEISPEKSGYWSETK